MRSVHCKKGCVWPCHAPCASLIHLHHAWPHASFFCSGTDRILSMMDHAVCDVLQVRSDGVWEEHRRGDQRQRPPTRQGGKSGGGGGRPAGGVPTGPSANLKGGSVVWKGDSETHASSGGRQPSPRSDVDVATTSHTAAADKALPRVRNRAGGGSVDKEKSNKWQLTPQRRGPPTGTPFTLQGEIASCLRHR